MSAAAVAVEIQRIRTRTRRAFVVSVVVHALFAIYLWHARKEMPAQDTLFEVSWLDPAVAVAPPPAGEPGAVEDPKPVRAAVRPSEIHFARETTEETAGPRPQDEAASRDRLQDRLASLQKASAQAPLQAAGLTTLASVVPSLSGLPGGVTGGSGSRPLGLVRGSSSGTGTAPLALARGGTAPPTGVPALQKLQEPRGSGHAPPLAAATTSRQVLSGITLRGPVADRALVTYAMPPYPEWAQRELVEGSVRLYFEVLPDGRVKENVVVEKTSGVQDFDDSATRALRRWRFEAISEGVGEQWGSITFDFKLNGTRE